MRKTVISFISVAAAAMALMSCAKEAKDSTIEKALKGITVNAVADAAATKTAAVDGEIPTIKWLDSDKIDLFEIVDGQEKGSATSANANIADNKASFSTTLSWEDPGGSSYSYSAVYPAGNIIQYNGKYYLMLEEVQHLTGNNFDGNSDILYSEPLDHGASRVGDSEDLMFSFRRLGTVVRLNLIGLAAGEKISTITLSGPAAIAGAIVYDPVTSTIDKSSAFEDYYSNSVYLYLDDYASSGSGDVIWFRVLPERNWAAGEEFSVKVETDLNTYKKEITLTSEFKFPEGGLTKFGVDISDSAVPPVAVPCLWDFEDGADGWTFIDNDGDGNNWFLLGEGSTPHSGSYVLTSASYDNDTGALYPDNLAFTPRIQLTEGNYLSFWVTGQDPDWQEEHYAVYIAKGNAAGELTELIPETTFPDGDYVAAAAFNYRLCCVQIPAEFDNEIVCIGFRHFNCSDMFRINLDDVSVTENPYTPTIPYDKYLGEWTSGSKEFTITQKLKGESYEITGFAGQQYPVEATYDGYRLVVKEQIVHTDGDTDIVLQGLFKEGDGLTWNDYFATEDLVLFRGFYDEEQDAIIILPDNSFIQYIWVTYIAQNYDSYGTYALLPQMLTPYIPDGNTYILKEGFEDGAGGWSNYDADGDGNNWGLVSGSDYSHSGNYCIYSASYLSGALDPDNYLFSPPVTLTSGNYLSWWESGYSTSYLDHYGVFISTEALDTEALGNFELLLEKDADGVEYAKVEIEIPSKYDGQTVYLAFRHFNSYDKYYLFLDDIAITEGPLVEASPAPAPIARPQAFSAGKIRQQETKNVPRTGRRSIPAPQLKIKARR